MTVREQAQIFIDEGLHVVPVVRGSKAPDITGWKTREFTADDFTDEHNIGIKLVDGVVDVDCDCPEAAKAALQLLPSTRRHGRPGNPNSHFWFRVAGVQTRTVFKDIDGKGLLEIRASEGGEKTIQTVVPPSVHESGDVLVWEHDRDMLKAEVEDFIRFVKATAIATLLARHWPTGSRHVAAGHVAGMLLRVGFDAMWTERIVRTAALVAGDEEYSDRARVARDTAAKWDKDEKVTGAPSLKKTFENGDKIVGRIYEWMGIEGQDILDSMNETHFFSMYGTKAVIAQELSDGSLKFLSFDSFREKYYNRKIGKVRLGEWWLSHPDQRRYEEVVFAPPPRRVPEGVYNAWKGFSVVPDDRPNPEERCAKYLNHLLRVICADNKAYFAYLLDWMAFAVQKPGVPVGVAVVMRGESGAGKGTCAELFGSLFGPHWAHISSQQQITGRFNAVLARKVYVFADEAVWAGSKQDEGNLKRLVTEKTLTIEHKFKDALSEINCIHLIMATNNEWAWPAMFKERRGFILDIAKFKWADEAYFDSVHDEWAAGGAGAMLAFLMARPIPARLGPIPQTDALIEQQELSMDPVQEWWLQCLQNGEIELGKGWPEEIANRTLFESYLDATKENGGRGNRIGAVAHGKRLVRLLPPGRSRTVRRLTAVVNVARSGPPRYEEIRVTGRFLPTLWEARRAFDEISGVKRQWDVIDEERDHEERGLLRERADADSDI